MRTLEERINKGIQAIAEAKAKGKDTTQWEEHLFNLIYQLIEGKRIVKVKMGAYGFCTCLLEKALCSGCWRVIEACTCRELEVNPEEEVTRQYAHSLKRVNKH